MIKGKVFKFGDDINTDVIFPGKYTYTVADPQEMAEHVFEDLDAEFVKKVRKGDIIVAGKNFGCGSSREQAVTCLKELGIGAIIAESFARIYFRNCLNKGLLAIVLKPSEIEQIQNNSEIKIDFRKGQVLTAKQIFNFPAFAPEIVEIIEAGGLIGYIKKIIRQ